jgi:ABC-2 type transport system ATP-binding protein
MIQTKALTKRYGDLVAVNRLTLHVPRGTIFGFIGPNGAGKTTTIKMLGGLIEPDAGSVLINGTDIKDAPELTKGQIGFIPDRPYLYEKLTGLEFLKFTADLYGVDEALFLEKAGRILNRFSLFNWKDELIEAYSHGMKQRLIMSAAILHDPQVIIVDEPMIGLDPAGIEMVRRLFRELADKGATFFISTHTLSIAQDLCDRIGIIQKGELIATGTLGDLQRRASAGTGSLESVFLDLTRGNAFLRADEVKTGQRHE